MIIRSLFSKIRTVSRKPYLIYFLGWFFIYVCIVGAVTIYSGIETEKLLLAQIDEQLLIAAKSIKYMLAPDFHDRAVDKNSITLSEELRNRKALSKFALETKLNFIYTLVPKEGKLYFTAPTITEEEERQQVSWYFQPYDDAPAAYWQALKKNRVVFASYSDQWGHFRSVALPQRSPKGRIYLSCADYNIDYVNEIIIFERLKVILGSIVLFLASLPLLFLYRLTYKSYTNELKHKNIELEKYHVHLQELVDARTKELLQAKEEAEEANRMKTRLLSSVSHEIRTPLHAIIAFSELMLHSKSVEEMHLHLRTIMGESKVLLRLINDLLDLSRLEAGKLDLKFESISVYRLLEEVKNFMQPVAREKGVALNLEADKGLDVQVLGDDYRIRQVLVNLIGNAIKFTDKGSVRIEAHLAREEGDRLFSVFRVIDTGIGIPPEKLKYIFQAFFQVDDSFSRRYTGTGLGTSIVKNLVERMGGRVGCSSQLGKGSIFWFELPFKKCGQQEALALKKESPGATPDASSFEGYSGKLLVVEDNEVNQAVVRQQLIHLGIKNIALAGNGISAIEECQKKNFDLILVDLHMPGMDGYEMAKKLRSLSDFYRSIPVIALTADTGEHVFEECQSCGINDVITKPIIIKDLAAILHKWLKANHQA